MRELKRFVGLFLIGALGYGTIEIFWRGYTHWTMLLTGGIVFVGLWLVDLQMNGIQPSVSWAMGTTWVTVAEFFVGVSVNLMQNMQVWDYSAEWGNFMGQVCPKYILLWFMLCGPAMLVARKSADLLAYSSKLAYNAKVNMPEKRILEHADCAGYRKQSYKIGRFLRGRFKVCRLDSNRRSADSGTIRLPAVGRVQPAWSRQGTD